MAWLPGDFTHPERVELATGHHLRPIRAGDVDIDYPAVMGSRERLWAKYREAWGWPAADMTFEADREDLARHEEEIAAHITFNYAVLDDGETELLGCVYIDPPDEVAGGYGGVSSGALLPVSTRTSSGAACSPTVDPSAIGTRPFDRTCTVNRASLITSEPRSG
jgi:hypothetical protein